MPRTDHTEVVYVTVKLTVSVVDKTSADAIAARLSSEMDYNFTHLDDVCEIVGTEILDVSATMPTI